MSKPTWKTALAGYFFASALLFPGIAIIGVE